ncbi:unnamed protein product [Gadus morhua 'NCC']
MYRMVYEAKCPSLLHQPMELAVLKTTLKDLVDPNSPPPPASSQTKTDQDIKGAKALSSGRLTLKTGVPITGRRQTQRLSRTHHYRRLLHDQTSPHQEGPLGRSTVPDNAS